MEMTVEVPPEDQSGSERARVPASTSKLEDNIAALEVRLTHDGTKRLNQLTAPQLPFPIDFLRTAPELQAGGTTINGVGLRAEPCRSGLRRRHYENRYAPRHRYPNVLSDVGSSAR
jgi:hypothetical protein